jgi:hypothetical protein
LIGRQKSGAHKNAVIPPHKGLVCHKWAGESRGGRNLTCRAPKYGMSIAGPVSARARLWRIRLRATD